MKSKELVEKICMHQDSRCFTITGVASAEELNVKLLALFDNARFIEIKDDLQADYLFVSTGQFLTAEMMQNYDALVVEKGNAHAVVYYLFAIKD